MTSRQQNKGNSKNKGHSGDAVKGPLEFKGIRKSWWMSAIQDWSNCKTHSSILMVLYRRVPKSEHSIPENTRHRSRLTQASDGSRQCRLSTVRRPHARMSPTTRGSRSRQYRSPVSPRRQGAPARVGGGPSSRSTATACRAVNIIASGSTTRRQAPARA
jgi:hypothetical protein